MHTESGDNRTDFRLRFSRAATGALATALALLGGCGNDGASGFSLRSLLPGGATPCVRILSDNPNDSASKELLSTIQRQQPKWQFAQLSGESCQPNVYVAVLLSDINLRRSEGVNTWFTNRTVYNTYGYVGALSYTIPGRSIRPQLNAQLGDDRDSVLNTLVTSLIGDIEEHGTGGSPKVPDDGSDDGKTCVSIRTPNDGVRERFAESLSWARSNWQILEVHTHLPDCIPDLYMAYTILPIQAHGGTEGYVSALAMRRSENPGAALTIGWDFDTNGSINQVLNIMLEGLRNR